MTIFQGEFTPDSGSPDAYEAPNGVEAVLPGVTDDAGSRDPSATTIAGAVANAMANMRELESDAVSPIGSDMCDPVDLPPNVY